MKKILSLLVVLALMNVVAAEVRIDSVSLDPYMVEAGDEVDVYVKFHESAVKRDALTKGGIIEAAKEDKNLYYGVKLVTASDISKQNVVIIEGQKNIGHVFIGETWTAPFRIKVVEGAEATDYKMEFQVISTDEDGKEKGIARLYPFNISVKGIVKFDVDSDDELEIGSPGTIDLKLENVGGGTARHVTVNLGTAESLTVLGSTENDLGAFTGKESKSVRYNIAVDSNAVTEAKEIPFTIAYINEQGQIIVLNRTIGATIKGEPSIGVSLESTEGLVAGRTGTISLSVINNGFIDAKFVTIKLLPSEQYTAESSETIYIGNLASDDFENEDFKVKLAESASGEIPFKVRVEYKQENKDELGAKEYEVKAHALTQSEYLMSAQANGTQSQIKTALLAIPALIVAYLALWFTVKVVGAITAFLNKKIFKRGV